MTMRTVIYTLTVFFSVFSYQNSFAQEPVADTKYQHYSYQDAIKQYKKVLRKDANNADALYKLANAYRLNGNTTEAEVWYSKAVMYNPEPKIKLYYAQTLLSNKKYAKAKKWFDNYAKVAGSPDDEQTAKNMADFCEKLYTEGEPEYLYEVHEVSFNTPKAFEFSPTFYTDSSIVFVSNREYEGNKKNRKDKWTGEHYMELFFAHEQENGKFSEPEKLLEETDAYYHEGPAVFNNTRDIIYYTKNDSERRERKYDENRNTRLGIYQSMLADGKWTAPEALSFSKPDYTVCHPALSVDEDFMIFASDMPGGYGGTDLYITYSEGGTWSVPENLGNDINTAGNEIFPYLDAYNNLYFSSDMHIGFGGLDIFKCFFEKKDTWSFPENFGVPVNSSKDDFGFAITADWYKGYFSSNRKGNDNIYSFNANEELIVSRGIEFEAGNKNSGKPGSNLKKPNRKKYGNTAENKLYICGTVINRKYKTPLNGANVEVVSLCAGEKVNHTTDEYGGFSFLGDKDCDYYMVATKENFRDTLVELSTFDVKNPEPCLEVEIPLSFDNSSITNLISSNNVQIKEGMVFELYNIYFDLDKYFIRSDAVGDLDKVYDMMIKYPNMTGEIGAHTDSRASHAYNITLSNNRAKSAVNYLVKRGIDRSRLTWKGYGETRLKNECSDGVPCTEEQHQRNRRVEFKVTYFDGVIESKEKYSDS